MFAVNLDELFDNPASDADDIDQRKEEILSLAKDRTLGFDATLVDDRLYIITRAGFGERATEGLGECASRQESISVDMKKLVTDVMGKDVEITPVTEYEKHAG